MSADYRRDYLMTEGQQWAELALQIKNWAAELGFAQCAVSEPDLALASERLQQWLQARHHGSMEWMQERAELRSCPEKLLPGTLRIISVRMDYLADNSMLAVLKSDDKAYISRYALGRDYHKLIRKRLAQLADKIRAAIDAMPLDASQPELIQRPFVDSAPVMEKPIAEQAGLGWIGKNTLLINSEAGSWFFLGELFTSAPLPVDSSDQTDQCGNCRACLTTCPTDAFTAPYQLDARRCIAYQTIENRGSIPVELRGALGNRVFGCDDCQIFCPWNREPAQTQQADFAPRHQLQDSQLAELFMWSEQQWLDRTAGSPIRRIGYRGWLRNLSVGLGNWSDAAAAIKVLQSRADIDDELVREHIDWALQTQRQRLDDQP